MPLILLIALLHFEAESAQEENLLAARVVRSYSGAAHFSTPSLRAGVQLFGGAGDALSQDPLRQEDFLGPEVRWLAGPRWTLKAQYARALRAGSDDVALVAASWTF